MLKAAITGIGMTALSRDSGRTVLELAVEAAAAALADAGLQPHDVDGVLSFHLNDSEEPELVASSLGCGPLRTALSVFGGGALSAAVVGQAALAVTAGGNRHVVVYRAMNGASGVRVGAVRTPTASGPDQFTLPYGFGGPLQWYAMACRRHMATYGTTPESLGAVAVAQREHANLNPRAVMHGKPLTLDGYFASPPIAEPFRLLDCCQETDGAAAVVVSATAAANDLRAPAISILAARFAAGPFASPPYEKYPDWTVMYPHWLASELFADAGVSPSDVDVASIYDAFTFGVVCQLEDFGFCPKGDGGAFVAEGRIRLDGGDLPVNTHGGLLSEGYVHGMNGIVEAVRQLRGDAGRAQVDGAEVALATGFGFSRGSALLLAAG